MRWPVRVEIKVPWRDVDAAGHVNNAVFFSYMETARAEAYLRAKGLDPEKARPEDVDMILARAECDFRSPAFFGETIVVEIAPGRIGSSSFEFVYRLFEKRTQRLVADAKSVQVAFDYATQRKKPLPEALRAALRMSA